MDVNTDNRHNPDNKLQDFLGDEPDEVQITTKRREMEELVKHNIQEAQRKRKQYCNQKHGASSCFSNGSVVLKKDFRRKKRHGGKLDYRWQGLYTIIATLVRGLFRLKEVDGEKVLL